MAQDYDKIIKENLAGMIPALLDKLLHVRLRTFTLLTLDIQSTLERRPDFLLLAQEEGSDAEHILQIEFQSSNDSEMALRLLEYRALLMRKYRKPVRQYVCYFGNEPMQMPNELRDSDLFFRYHLLDLQTFDYRLFIDAPAPRW
ncbi:MAG: hypothetical protein OHK0039_27470 [Bacteroidia bacterium]